MPSGVYIRTEYHRKINSNGHKGQPGNRGTTGMKFSKETRQKMSLASKGKPKSEEHKENMSGKNNHNWKGYKVKYRTLHGWVQRNLGKANHCEHCGATKVPEGKKRWFQWANKSHKYLRDLTDWIQLCISCHKKYDKK